LILTVRFQVFTAASMKMAIIWGVGGGSVGEG
jgi:hypothetical protein